MYTKDNIEGLVFTVSGERYTILENGNIGSHRTKSRSTHDIESVLTLLNSGIWKVVDTPVVQDPRTYTQNPEVKYKPSKSGAKIRISPGKVNNTYSLI